MVTLLLLSSLANAAGIYNPFDPIAKPPREGLTGNFVASFSLD